MVPVVAFTEVPVGTLVRSVSGGRPWEYVLCQGRRPAVRGRVSVRQAKLVANWGLCDGGLLLCNLKIAEEKLRRYLAMCSVGARDLNQAVLAMAVSVELRDRLGMVWYPGDVCPTLTSNNAPYWWVGGPPPQGGRFVSPSEVASYMGLDVRTGSFPAALVVLRERCLSDWLLYGWVAESVHGRVADYVAGVGRSMFVGCCATVGSLYSGAFDELSVACVRCFGPLSYVFAAESCVKKAEVLRRGRCPGVLYECVAGACGAPHVDVLVASPSCLSFSTANRGVVDSVGEALAQVGEMRAVLLSSRPCVFILEQTVGLKSHHAEAYGVYQAFFGSIPYFVRHGVVGARESFQASHCRSRLMWVCSQMFPL